MSDHVPTRAPIDRRTFLTGLGTTGTGLALAAQLLTLVEGAIAGALIDHHAGAARHARELTRIALASAGPAR